MSDIKRIAKAICKSKTCEGFMCCQNPAQMGRLHCPVVAGGYDDAASAAIQVCADIFAEHLEQIVEDRRKLRPRLQLGNDYIMTCVNIIRHRAAKALFPNSPSLPTPAATPTDSANPPPVESVGPNSEAQS